MENFISKILLCLSFGDEPLPLEKALPTLMEWKRSMLDDVLTLQDFKC